MLTRFQRVDPRLVSRGRHKPQLVAVLLGIRGGGAKALGLTRMPPAAALDGGFENVLRLLSGAGFMRAYQALSRAHEIDSESTNWVRAYTVAKVSHGASTFTTIDLKALTRICLDRHLISDNGLPLEGPLLRDAINNFKTLRRFWVAATRSGQAIIASSACRENASSLGVLMPENTKPVLATGRTGSRSPPKGFERGDLPETYRGSDIR